MRHTVGFEDLGDLLVTVLQFGIEAISKCAVSFANSDPNVEVKWKFAIQGVFLERRQRQWNSGVLRKVACKRSPGDGDVEFAIDHSIQKVGLRILLRKIAEDAEAYEIPGDSAARKSVDGRKAVSLFAQHVDANAKRTKPRIVEGGDIQIAIAPCNKDIGRAVIGVCCLRLFHAYRHSHHNIAESLLDGLAKEILALRKPEVLKVHVHVASNKIGDLVFEPMSLVIGVGKIAWICADTHGGGPRRLQRMPWRAGLTHAFLVTEDIERVSRLSLRLNLLHRADRSERGVRIIGRN